MIATILILGLVWTFIYVLVALGFSLLFGVAGVLNLSHGMLAMVAVYVCYWFMSVVGLSLGISSTIGVLITILLGIIMYYTLIKRFLNNESSLLLITVGVAFAIEAIFILTVGPTNRSIPAFIKGRQILMGVSITNQQILIIGLGIVGVLLPWFVIQKTKFGIAVRAVSQDRDVAEIHGIEAGKISIYVMILGTIFTAVGGLVLVPIQAAVPQMGWTIMVSAFTVTILGGIGDIRGVAVASAIVAYSELLTAFTISPMMKEAATFTILIFTLLLRPKGLFGK